MNPLNQNFRAKVRKLGYERSRFISLAKRVSRSINTKDVGSLLLVLERDEDFDVDINDNV